MSGIDRQRLHRQCGQGRQTRAFTLHYDATPPTITGWNPSRPPDHNGWYNHPVAFTFTGTDATSGLDSCTTPTYAGPDSGNASATGSCRDKAGNVASLAVPLRYDATPPCLGANAAAGDGIVFVHSLACAGIKIVRSPGLHGKKSSTLYHGGSGAFKDTRVRNGVRYTYTISAEDQAGNVAVRSIAATPGPRLLTPAPNAHLTTPPLLLWTARPGASYYNVQLYRDGRKVLSVWPADAKLQLSRVWSFAGHRYRLKPARYRWYVWPGFGRRAASRYGSLIGRGTFVVTSPQL